MGLFIYEKHIEALSDQAITVLAMEEMKKPLHLRNVVNWGSTVITNKGHLEQQRMIQLDKAKKDDEKLNADKEKQIMNDIAKVKAIEKREFNEAKRILKENEKELDATKVYELFQSGYNNKIDDNINKVFKTWKHTTVPIIKNAYHYYIVTENTPKSEIEVRKGPMIDALETYFENKISEISIEENEK